MSEKAVQIGFVGGGRGAFELLKVLTQSSLVKILFVCDRNPEAPGAAFAKSHGIRVLSELDDELLAQVEFVFEVTRVPAVVEELKRRVDHHKIIDSQVALFLFKVMADHSRQTNSHINADIHRIKEGIISNTQQTKKILENIRLISNELRIISLNMGIEASRMGAQAAGFTIIAAKVQNSVSTVKSLADEIEKINTSMGTAIDEIEAARMKLANNDP